MPTFLPKFDEELSPEPVAGVFLLPRASLVGRPRPLTINGRIATAVAPHPANPELIYVTTESPESLEFLRAAVHALVA